MTIPTPQATDFQPIGIGDIELTEPLPVLSAVHPTAATTYQGMWAVVRLRSMPVAQVQLDFGGQTELHPDDYRQTLWQDCQQDVHDMLQSEGITDLPTSLPFNGLSLDQKLNFEVERQQILDNQPFISIAICTRNRTDMLEKLLKSMATLLYDNYEVVIVDNIPDTDETRHLVEVSYGHDERFRYFRVMQPGLSRARNYAIEQSRGEFVLFVDDDALLDRYWALDIVRKFKQSSNIMCVTCSILPAELETQSQLWFELFAGGFNRGFKSRLFDMKENRPRRPFFYPYIASVFGAGASMAFRREVFNHIGKFDLALAAPNPSKGGEDLDLFFRVVTNGYQLAYQPGAMIRHHHRRDYESFKKQVHSYGISDFARLTKCMLEAPWRIPGFLIRLPYIPYVLFVDPPPERVEKEQHKELYPDELKKLTRKGRLQGPLAYLKSRWMLFRRSGHHRPLQTENMV